MDSKAFERVAEERKLYLDQFLNLIGQDIAKESWDSDEIRSVLEFAEAQMKRFERIDKVLESLVLFEPGPMMGENVHPIYVAIRDKINEKQNAMTELIGKRLLELMNGQ